MKKNYCKPYFDIVEFESDIVASDIIIASTLNTYDNCENDIIW